MSAYFVFHNRVHDAEKLQQYAAKVGETLAPYAHEILVFTDPSEVIEGETSLSRTVVLKFESREAAKAWYQSAAYQAVLPLRLQATEGYAVLVDSVQ
jgi:uncharacterized protein (DUF1330 family)